MQLDARFWPGARSGLCRGGTEGAHRARGQQRTQFAMDSKSQIPGPVGSPAVSGSARDAKAGRNFPRRCNFHSTLAPSSSHAGRGRPGETIPVVSLSRGGRDPAKLPAPAACCGHSRGPWRLTCGALGPAVVALLKMTNQKKKKICFSPRISSVLQSAQVPPPLKRKRMPTSVLLLKGVWSSRPGT